MSKPTRDDFETAHNIFADNGRTCMCCKVGDAWTTCVECRAAETITAYADDLEQELEALKNSIVQEIFLCSFCDKPAPGGGRSLSACPKCYNKMKPEDKK